MARSSPRCPGTVTNPRFDECLNCRWLPRIRTWYQPSVSSSRMTSLTFMGWTHLRYNPLHNVPVQRRAAQRTVRCNRLLCSYCFQNLRFIKTTMIYHDSDQLQNLLSSKNRRTSWAIPKFESSTHRTSVFVVGKPNINIIWNLIRGITDQKHKRLVCSSWLTQEDNSSQVWLPYFTRLLKIERLLNVSF